MFLYTGRNFMKIRLCFLLVSSWIPMSETDDQNNKLTISGLHLNVAIAQVLESVYSLLLEKVFNIN